MCCVAVVAVVVVDASVGGVVAAEVVVVDSLDIQKEGGILKEVAGDSLLDEVVVVVEVAGGWVDSFFDDAEEVPCRNLVPPDMVGCSRDGEAVVEVEVVVEEDHAAHDA